jgi:hypothetical protein
MGKSKSGAPSGPFFANDLEVNIPNYASAIVTTNEIVDASSLGGVEGAAQS